MTPRAAAPFGHSILEEEKMMRRVTKELPKLTERLRHAVQAWEEENGELCYKGVSTRAAAAARHRTNLPTPSSPVRAPCVRVFVCPHQESGTWTIWRGRSRSTRRKKPA